MNKEEKQKLIKKMEGLNLPEYENITDSGLYLEQTAQYINDCLQPSADMEITNSMISNYVKQGVLPKSIKKRYYREHIVRLIFLVVAKSVLSLDHIRILFALQKQAYDDKTAYEYLRLEVINIAEYVFGIKESIDEIGITNTQTKEALRKTIIAFVHKYYLDAYLEIEKEHQQNFD